MKQTISGTGAKDYAITVLHYVIAAAIILNQHTIWRYLESTSSFMDTVIMLALVISIALCMALKGAFRFSGKVSGGFAAVFAVMMYLAVFTILNPFYRYYFIEFAIGVFAVGIYYFTCNKNAFPEILKAYTGIIAVIAGISLIMWLLCSILKVIPPTGTVLTGWNPSSEYLEINTYLGIYFEPQEFYLFKDVFFRNSACFAEAPMASLAFTLGLMMELFLPERTGRIKTIILYLAVISTCSATGIILGTAAIVLKLGISRFIPAVRRIQEKGKKRAVTVIIIFSIAAVGAVLVYILAFKLDTWSGSIRIDDYKVGIKTWLDAPLIGHGYANDYSLMEHMGTWRKGNYGFSNSITQLLAHGGIFLGALYLAAFISGIVRSIKRKQWLQLCFAVLILVLFCTAIWTYTFIIVVLLYYFAFDRDKYY